MLRTELLELLTHLEGSKLEFKEDTVAGEDFAREMVALTNHDGGHILLGVEDETGDVVGLTRTNLEEWVFNIARDKVRPPLNPTFEVFKDVEKGKDVAVITVDRGLTIHRRLHNGRERYYIRAGSTCREPSPEELERLFQRRGSVRAETQVAPGTQPDDLDEARLNSYFRDVREQPLAPMGDPERERILLNLDLLGESPSGLKPTVAGLALFGRSPASHLPLLRLDLVAFAGDEPDYDIVERLSIDAPLVRLNADSVEEWGGIEQAVNFVSRHISVATSLVNGAHRQTMARLPQEPIREAVVNAVAHRDYLLLGRQVQVRVFTNGVEVLSPGRPVNGVTIESMKLGDRASRNELIMDVLRDYNYVDRLGMGVSRKIIKIMTQFNGTEPTIELDNETLRVRLATVD